MRTIKFRGKTLEDNKWVYGSLFLTTPNPTIITGDGTDRNQFHFVDKETVGEFTGMHDKTKWKDLSADEQKELNVTTQGEKYWIGREIYEGDFLESNGHPFKNLKNGYGEVLYKGNMFKLGSISLCTFLGRVIVIGNKYDNKELLQEKIGS